MCSLFPTEHAVIGARGAEGIRNLHGQFYTTIGWSINRFLKRKHQSLIPSLVSPEFAYIALVKPQHLLIMELPPSSPTTYKPAGPSALPFTDPPCLLSLFITIIQFIHSLLKNKFYCSLILSEAESFVKNILMHVCHFKNCPVLKFSEN
ncbi:hypothetical protein LIER_23343 [Lithospermum erythrorhizon]|uniref:Uncharacterized protein n=1 Tax=Lithospermum erythrorhizon TaxID=34254 RepID=A0AAV3R0C1_LITER